MEQDWEASLPDNDAGLEESFFGQHMTSQELDAEFLSRIDPSKLKDLSSLNEAAWFGYRFLHPGARVYLFIHHYQKAYTRTGKLLGKRWARPRFLRSNPLENARKATVSGFVAATFNADAHGVPYDIWCDTIMDQSLRAEIARPPQPTQMYTNRVIGQALDAWRDRNQRGIYLARAPQYHVDNYAAHPWQDAYQDHLCDLVTGKGNRAFWLGRLIHNIHQLRPEHATKRFGEEVVAEAARHK